MIVILEPCRRELLRLPAEVRADLADALARLDEGHMLAPEGDQAMKKTGAKELATALNLPKSRTMEAVVKAELISAVLDEIKRQGLTHAQLASRADLARSTVTGILGGSLQKVTIDRILRLVDAAGLEAHVRVKRAA